MKITNPQCNYCQSPTAFLQSLFLGRFWLAVRMAPLAITKCFSGWADSSDKDFQSKTVGLLVRRHIVAGVFHYIGKEASTRWASGADLSMMVEAGALDSADETFREYERVVDTKYLEEIRVEAKQFSTKLLSRRSRVAECAIRHFKNGKNVIKARTLRKTDKSYP